MNNQKVADLTRRHILPTYDRLPVAFVRGKGAWVWDADGKKYLDFFAGLAVCNLGYAHPKITAALRSQAGRLLHTSNVFHIGQQALLAKELTRLTGMEGAFFCNSGTEAVEACLKFARYYSLKNFDENRYEVIVFENSFHGRTYGSLSATAQKKYQEGFGPLLPGFKVVPFNNLEAVEKAVSPSTCAILVEPIQGEGGVRIPDNNFLPGLREIANRQRLLLIFDEVQVGMGRTGKFLSSEHAGVKPDLVALAKGLGSGVPIGASLVGAQVAKVVKPGMHASTFGGNPLACSAALATLSILGKKSFLDEVAKKGAYFLSLLRQLQSRHSLIREVRGLGLLVACELGEERGKVFVEKCLEKGLLINSIQNRILRFVPPLVISRGEIDKGISILDGVFKEMG